MAIGQWLTAPLWSMHRTVRQVGAMLDPDRTDTRRFPGAHIANVTQAEPDDLARYRREFRGLAFLRRWKELRLHHSNPGGAGDMGRRAELLYVTTRALRPETILETGVSAGLSTTFLLAALEQNGTGHLHSIDPPFEAGDAPPYEHFGSYLPAGEATGWAIPGGLRSRWTLIEGDSLERMPEWLATAGPVDLFHHDSAHTYDHMMGEFRLVWPHLGDQGILIADDIELPPRRYGPEVDPFHDFAAEVERAPAYFRGMGLLARTPIE